MEKSVCNRLEDEGLRVMKEYKFVEVRMLVPPGTPVGEGEDEPLEEIVDQVALEGWELVNMAFSPTSLLLLAFSRPVPVPPSINDDPNCGG